jgi:hypothetical protein
LSFPSALSLLLDEEVSRAVPRLLLVFLQKSRPPSAMFHFLDVVVEGMNLGI